MQLLIYLPSSLIKFRALFRHGQKAFGTKTDKMALTTRLSVGLCLTLVSCVLTEKYETAYRVDEADFRRVKICKCDGSWQYPNNLRGR